MIRKLICEPYKRLRLVAGMIRSHKPELYVWWGLVALPIVVPAVIGYLSWRSSQEQVKVGEAQYELSKTQEERQCAQDLLNAVEKAKGTFRQIVERRILEGKDVSLDLLALQETDILEREARKRMIEGRFKESQDLSTRILTILWDRCAPAELGCASIMEQRPKTQEAY